MLKRFISYISKILNNRKRIYLDYASLTPIDRQIVREIDTYSSSVYANPSSLYKEGEKAKVALRNARAKVAQLIYAHSNEIYFTSGGTESNNLAILGTIESLHEKGVEYEKMHVLISVIEHSSIRECANVLSTKGVNVELIPVNKEGIVDVSEIRKMIRPSTVLVSVMTVNNEIGSVQPIREIARAVRHFRSNFGQNSAFVFQNFIYPIFHTDASQASLYEDLNAEKLGVDLLTLDGSKIYGPRGVGIIFIKKETPILPIIFGGGQESGIRSGTENIPAIMGFVKALEIAKNSRESEAKRVGELRTYFIDELKKIRPDIILNGPQASDTDKNQDQSRYSPHILNITIPKIDNEFFVLQLDAKGVCCSTKSSCLGDEAESYVLNAIGANSKESIRFSFGRWTTKKDLERVIKTIETILST